MYPASYHPDASLRCDILLSNLCIFQVIPAQYPRLLQLLFPVQHIRSIDPSLPGSFSDPGNGPPAAGLHQFETVSLLRAGIIAV